MHLSVALAQLYPKLGDLHVNLAKHLRFMEQAKGEGAELVVFPELSMTGYFLQDLLYECALQPLSTDPIFGELLQATRNLTIDAVVGFPERDSRGRYYISAAYLAAGEVLHVHRKVYLPTYGMFIDGRFFTPGSGFHAFDTRYGRVGMLICEDFWHVSSPYLLWLDGADILIFPTDSPGRGVGIGGQFGSAEWGAEITRMYGGLFGAHVLYCNRVGFEDGINFFGGSCVADPNGTLIITAPQFEESLTVYQLDLGQIRRSRAAQPLLRDEQTALVLRELGRIQGS
jgi:predicted amidohydrolase